MSRVLRIGARKSTLAKLQAYMVGHKLAEENPDIIVEYRFQDSAGDKDLTSPLWKMEGKGVFTKDFHEALLRSEIDLVVHSWKDLDLEPRPDTIVRSVLPRADQRDIVLLKKSTRERSLSAHLDSDSPLRILTSSPRREYNLRPFLGTYLPIDLSGGDLQFHSVRGNIQTRIRKFIESENDGLILAKAALDRLLGVEIENLVHCPDSEKEEFLQIRKEIRSYLRSCLFMILPLSANPCAPAQGGLAVEFCRPRNGYDSDSKSSTLNEMIKKLVDRETEITCEEERKFLSQFGGGCHQKIGISVLSRPFGRVHLLRGLPDSGEELSESYLTNRPFQPSKNRFSVRHVWPPNAAMAERSRGVLDYKIPEGSDFFVSRCFGLLNPESPFLNYLKEKKFLGDVFESGESLIWTAGKTTWRELAERGIWVHGTQDNLGESEPFLLETLLGRSPKFVRFTHSRAEKYSSEEFRSIAAYTVSEPLIPQQFSPKKVQAAFWRSPSEFDSVTTRYPKLAQIQHYCGPGKTYSHILSKGLKPNVYLSFQDWIAECVDFESQKQWSIRSIFEKIKNIFRPGKNYYEK